MLWGDFLGCCFRKFGGYQILIGNLSGKLAAFLQNIFQEKKAFFFKDGISFPGVLGLVPFYDFGQRLEVGFLKLRLDSFGNLLRCVRIYIVQAFLDGMEQRILTEPFPYFLEI